ncbi:DUF2520 domain-containing protein [Terrimonas sp. NA20]|uniref:DUF2520 domain-containing protein n=1 Tax=Terrimonas ginsenosidimutans TaxID=2908004 RepID=A0ABS9KYS6_9BACT|nr:DUF2520 domain-containing protein [Terrimonas ginsenosidimutans]MCG2617471.1 DUF2520 domain-containing protein [Terrimonas ginsenosidimutans]
MNIVIVGSGNTAAILGRKFKRAGHEILQVVSRNASAASQLAYEWDTESANYISLLNKNADVYIIAVSDTAVKEITADLRLPGKVVAHTAAAVPADVLRTVTDHYGVFYPLQTLRKEMNRLPDIPVYVDGHDKIAKQVLEQLALSVSYYPPADASDEQRLKLHVAAVVVNNFVNHLFSLAEEYCKREGIAFAQLLPLIDETVSRIKEVSPKQAQTGPAIRHDDGTIAKHLEILAAHPELQRVYEALTASIQRSE